MRNFTNAVLCGVVVVCLWVMLIPASSVTVEPRNDPQAVREHQLETYLSALEWCESSGLYAAINQIDLDGTASYSNFQWKVGTFLDYGKQYGLISATTTIGEAKGMLVDYDLQRAIVRDMSQDKTVDWAQQFPGCTKKLGRPPQLSTA